MSQVYGAPSLRVFLSGTYEDLKAYVQAAEEVLSKCVEVDHFKHWEATGRPSVSVCRDRVHACDALVVLVGKTYGWIPRVEEGGDGRTSITRFEVRWAGEKTIPVVPFFIHDASQVATDLSPDAARLQSEFVAELQSMLGTPVSSLEVLRQALRRSISALAGQFRETGFSRPAQVGLRTQGLYSQFLDREESRHRLRSILAEGPSRGAVIVGRGGLGKSALANCVIDELQSDRVIKQVIYLDPASAEPIEFVLFRSTMEASGRPKGLYEGSWAALNANHQALIEVLLKVYQQGNILLMFDAFEHHLEKGAIRSPMVRAFVKAFVESNHTSKLLITTRQFPLLSATEAAALQEILLDGGLPFEAGVSLLESQSPVGTVQREQIEAAVEAVDGIPFALEHGLALHALGRWTEAIDAFWRGREAGRKSWRRRARGLIAVNWGWALYDRGDLVGALSQIHDAIRAFDGISEADARLSHNLREAFEYAQDGNRRYEAEALWSFVASDYVNPDLIRRVAVAERILSLEGRVPSHTRQLAQAYVDETSSTLTGLRAELDT